MPEADTDFLFEDETPAAQAAPPEAEAPEPEADSEFLFSEEPQEAAPPEAEAAPAEESPYTEVTVGADEEINPVTGMIVPKETSEASREIILPWMRFHEFVLVRTAQELDEIVDKAIAHGSCGLDLETEGFDNRINYDANGKPSTVHQIVGVCLSVKGTGYYVPVRHEFNTTYDEPDPNVPPHLVEASLRRLCQAAQPVLSPEGFEEDPLGSSKIAQKGQVLIKFWNAKFDQEFLYPVTGVDYWHPSSFEDGLLLRYCIYTDDTLKLKDQAKLRLKVKDPKTEQEHPYEMIRFADLFPKGVRKKGMKIQTLHPLLDKNVTRYGCSDAICTEMLVDQFLPEIKTLKVEFVYLVEKHVAQVIRQVERTRTKINRAAVAQVLTEAEAELLSLDKQIKELAKSKGFNEFNPHSTAQLSQLLFGKDGLDIEPKPPMTEGGQYKTDAETLEGLLDENPNAPPVLKWILHFRQIQRIIGTYLNRFLSDCDDQDQLRFNFNQTGAATGRFTAPAGDPDHGFFGGPIQGIPARDDPKKPKVAHSLRRVFVAREGYTLCKADYAGQELRLVANVSGEPLWINEFLHGSGDLHSLTARAFFNIPADQPVAKHHRTAGKTANFALVYGGGVQAVRRATGVDKVEAARQKQAFDQSVPEFTKWLKGQHARVKKSLGIRTAFGRWIAIPDANIRPGGMFATSNGKEMQADVPLARKIQASCERKSVNYPIQGAGADVMKISLVRLFKEFFKRGWLKMGGDDSVRMLMTIHDEIVFEIRHDRLEEAIPLLCQVMSSPTQKLTAWKIPLIVEPLVGLDWSAKYDWEKIKKGDEKHPIPDWLTGYITVGEPHLPPPAPTPTQAPQATAPAPAPVPTTPPATKESPTPTPPPVPTPAPEAVRKPAIPGKEPVKIAVFSISTILLSERSVKILNAICMLTAEDGGLVLRLTDETGNILIDSAKQIRVNPDFFGYELRTRNLGPGTFEIVSA